MTEAPPRQPDRLPQSAAAIALILSSQAPQATKVSAVAETLFDVAREAATLPVETAAKIARALAELAIVRGLISRRRESQRGAEGPQGVSPGASGTWGIRAPQRDEPAQRGREVRPQRVEEDEILRRAMYTVRGSQRLALDIAKGADPSEALEKESRHYLSHTEAQQKRRTAKKLRDVMREEHNGMASWQHGDPKEPRILHEKADGHNVNLKGSAPRATGGDWPGEKPGCTCSLAPPRPGAMVLE